MKSSSRSPLARTMRRLASHHRTLRLLLCVLAVALTGCLDAVVGDVDLCKIDGKGYALNESFPASDGCNTCTCQLDGTAACTDKACLADGGAGGGSCTYGG